METQLQQRVVGAIVLVTLGVIFIPALLDGSGYKARQLQDIVIKDKPEFPPLTQKRLEAIPTPLEKIKIQQDAALESDPEKRHEKVIKSFALQVGSFSNVENAENFRNTLRKAGYGAFVQESQSNGRATYNVKVGPELERSVLDKWKKDLKKSHKIDAFVVNHP